MQLKQISLGNKIQTRLKPVCLYVIILLSLALLSGCSNSGKIIRANLGEAVAIGVGQSARVGSENLEIKFENVIGDSRCPSNVVCVWAGVASIRVTITSHGDTYSMALNQPGLSGSGTSSFLDYTLTYNLEPYPVAGVEVSPDDYSLTLTVSK